MTSNTAVCAEASYHAAMTRKALAIAAMFLFLGFVGTVPEAAAQERSQNQGTVSPQQIALGQNLQQDSFPQPATPTGVWRTWRDRSVSQQNHFPQPAAPTFPITSRKRKQALVNYNFKKLKKHAAALAELAKSLQEDIEKSNANVLSLKIVRKAEKAEKLAKKIKDEAKAY